MITLIPTTAPAENIDTTDEYLFAVIKIIELLEDNAIYDEEGLMGWPYRLNSTIKGDERWYRGYTTGMAGIGDFLLHAYQSGIIESKKLLDEIIKHFLLDFYVSNDRGIYWGRFANENTAGWLGVRYGTSGILKFLGHVYKDYNSSSELLQLIEKGYEWLVNQEDSEGWPITPTGYITTGWEYGALGIADAMFDLYKATANDTYLKDTKRVTDWLIDLGTWDEDILSIPWTPIGEDTEFEDLSVTGLGAGEAGIIEFLIRLYAETSNEEYRNAAIGLGNHLVSVDQGGFWKDGSVSYITKLYSDNTGLTGYFVGSTGIAKVMFDLYDLSNDKKYLESAVGVEKFVGNYLHVDRVDLGINLEASQFTGLSKGSAGVALYYLELFERYQIGRHELNGKNILNHLVSLLDVGLIAVDEKESPNILGFSFNLDEGLAGIGEVLIKAGQLENKGLLNNYEEIYKTATANFTPLTEPQDDSIYLNLIYLSTIILIILGILSIYKRKMR